MYAPSAFKVKPVYVISNFCWPSIVIWPSYVCGSILHANHVICLPDPYQSYPKHLVSQWYFEKTAVSSLYRCLVLLSSFLLCSDIVSANCLRTLPFPSVKTCLLLPINELTWPPVTRNRFCKQFWNRHLVLLSSKSNAYDQRIITSNNHEWSWSQVVFHNFFTKDCHSDIILYYGVYLAKTIH